MNTPTPYCRLVFPPLVVALLLAAPGVAQISETCDGSENLSGSDTLPQNLNLSAPLGNDLTMSGTCSEEGVDAVTCFVPQNSCTIDVTCNYVPGATTMAVNLYQGACSTSQSTCQAASSGASPVSVTNQSVTAGLQYCVVCESLANATSIDISISENTGSCGALPVTLDGFSIARSEGAGGSAERAGR